MSELTIDLDKLKKSSLFIEEYFCLQLIFEGINPENFNWTDKDTIRILSDNLWIKHTEGNEYQLRQKGRDLFDKPNNSINFDEIWEIFPITTRTGRTLRAANKEFSGKPTKDYITCRTKYLSKVKNIEIHNKIVSIIKGRIAANDYEYINGLEVYINKNGWEKDVKYLNQGTRVTAR